MIQYIIAAGIGAFLGSRSKKSKKSYAKGGIVEGRYSSIYEFIDTNNLEQEANDLFGEGWEAENDIEQIRALAGENYYVGAIEIKTKRDERADDYIEVEKYAKGGEVLVVKTRKKRKN